MKSWYASAIRRPRTGAQRRSPDGAMFPTRSINCQQLTLTNLLPSFLRTRRGMNGESKQHSRKKPHIGAGHQGGRHAWISEARTSFDGVRDLLLSGVGADVEARR